MIGFLCGLEGFSFVSGLPFPDNPFVGTRPVLSSRAWNGFDITANQRNDFPVGHVVVDVPCGVFYQSWEGDAAGPERDIDWNGHSAEARNLCADTFVRKQCPYSDRAPENDAASARVLRLPGERVGPRGSACPDRPPSEKPSLRPHLHIDYLRAHTRLHSVWFSYDGTRCEHKCAHVMQTVRGANIPLVGFRASDCDCRSHLHFFKRCPARINFQRGLDTLVKRNPPVEGF